ncbi:hypothetical protein DL766_000603 [Monosporascus sp. MC13-8B]|uniref:Uncharacterized protein n=1 Tax=Monosporascus cannonballus TaxID=155416 RepID=A0ABY0HML4_9PEZI|nr:hypothetical protein DL762_000650 [Monosporascus cannonballus]RYP01405.1 hypothetical protein DL763_000215 [Monosporascus cannonballus]RYP39061.1 hypothetical protein DL766_000603 [Monosporascus sp. MC13-8B]
MENGPTEGYRPRNPQPPPRQTPMYEDFEAEGQPGTQFSLMRAFGVGQYPRRREPARSDGQTSGLQRENAKLRDTNRQLRQQVDSLQSRLDNMEQSLASQEAQIVRAQAYVFENMNSDTWASGDDNTIRGEIEKLQSRIKSWAKKNAIDEMSSLERLDSDESATFLEFLANVARLDRTDLSNPQRALAHLTTTLMNKKSPMMCLQALLAYHVYSGIIERPFFALDSDDGTLQSVYRELKRVNEKEAHAWRSKIFQLLVKNNADAKPVDPANRYGTAQVSTCRNLAEDFYTGPAAALIKRGETEDEANRTLQDLDSITQYAGGLSSRLWSRRTALEVKGLPELMAKPFTIRSGIMNAHALHRLFSEADDSCDGRLVSIVVHPAVIGFGGGIEEDNAPPRVWMKAEVWLGEPPVPGTQ